MRLVISVYHPILDRLGKMGRAAVLKAKKFVFRWAG
jgi:hypothetical protein